MGFQVWANRRNYHIFDRRDDINDNLDWPKRWPEMASDAEMFAKLVRKTAEVLDPDDPKKKVFQKVFQKEDN